MSVADVSDDGPGLGQVLFSPKGRLPRLDTMFAIFCVLVIAIAVAGLWVGLATAYRQQPGVLLVPGVWGPAATVGAVAAWSVVCLLAKRCHDRSRSGLFLLIALVPLVNLWPMIDLFFLPGTPDLNRFGPPPVGMVQQWHAANRDL